VVAAYNDANVVVYPSLQEGFPIVPLEAAVMGRPLVVTDDPSVRFVGENNCGIVVKYNDVIRLAEALNTILEDPGLAKALGESARNVVLDNFTWSKVAQRIEQLYLEILT